MKLTLKTMLAATLIALPTLTFAHDFHVGDLTIDHPMAFETAATMKAGGGFVTITNTGDTDDALLGVKADFPKVDIHESYEENGVAKMGHVDRIEIPAGETVELAPGGYHVMFMGLSAPLVAGESFPATLVFEKAGEVEIMFSIETRANMDHSGHGDHSNHSDHGEEHKSE